MLMSGSSSTLSLSTSHAMLVSSPEARLRGGNVVCHYEVEIFFLKLLSGVIDEVFSFDGESHKDPVFLILPERFQYVPGFLREIESCFSDFFIFCSDFSQGE